MPRSGAKARGRWSSPRCWCWCGKSPPWGGNGAGRAPPGPGHGPARPPRGSRNSGAALRSSRACEPLRSPRATALPPWPLPCPPVAPIRSRVKRTRRRRRRISAARPATMSVTRSGRRFIGALLAATVLAVTAAQAAEPWGGALALTSDYVFRGVSQTDGQAAVQADLHARSGTGWFGGAWASTVKPAPSYETAHELDLYAGYGWALSDRWAATIAYVRYLYPDAPPYSHYDAYELSAALRFDDRLSLSAAVSPDARRYSVAGWSARRTGPGTQGWRRDSVRSTWRCCGSASIHRRGASSVATRPTGAGWSRSAGGSEGRLNPKASGRHSPRRG